MKSTLPQVFHSSTKAKSFCKNGTSLCIGNFDGIHRGHQKLIQLINQNSPSNQFKKLVYSFEPHPVRLLSPQVAPLLINTLDQKIELLQNQNIDGIILEKFDKDFAKLSPVEFFEKVLIEKLQVKSITVGYDFSFGSKRSGTIKTLEKLCQKYDVECHIMPAYLWKNTLVSSTIIRQYLQNGQVKIAKQLLNRPYFIEGKVKAGFKRGTTLGFSTANLDSINEITPKDGVYASLVNYKNKTYKSITNIGRNPTFGENPLSIETHIFDFDQDLYNQKIRLNFIDFIRDEKKFSNQTELVEQIKKDIGKAQNIIKKYIEKYDIKI